MTALLTSPQAAGILNLADRAGRTPLLIAASSGNTAAVSLLLDSGASSRIRNAQGESALHFCARFGHAAVVKLLAERLEVRTICLYCTLFFTELHQDESGVYKQPPQSGDQLPVFKLAWFRATKAASTNLKRLHTKRGTKVLKKTNSARTSIFNCQIIDEKDGMHRSPLHLAARYNHLKVVETLVREGANINSKDYQSKAPDMSINAVVS